MSTNLECRERKRQPKKRTLGYRPAKLNEKIAGAREKKQQKHFLMEEQHEIL